MFKSQNMEEVMKNKLTILASGLILIMVVMGLNLLPGSPSPKVVEMKVMKVGGIWKVINVTDSTSKEARVKKKDTIVWTLVGTDANFQLPANLLDAVTSDDSIQPGKIKFVKDGKKLKQKVKDSAVAGTYIYSVFCIRDSVNAIGGSPPKIIIE